MRIWTPRTTLRMHGVCKLFLNCIYKKTLKNVYKINKEFIFLCFVDLAWTTEGLDVQRQWLDENRLHGSYGNDVIARIQNLIRKYIPAKDKSFLVIGSTRPWIEVILLAEGAKHITTLEYNPYPCDHPNITTISPTDFSDLVRSKVAPQFDAMVSFSSLEHSGLGR